MADSEGFGRRVLQARLNMAARLGRPVTQQEVADQLKVTQGTVGRWETGTKEPDLATIERLAAVLETDPRWLAFGNQPPVNGGKGDMDAEMDAYERDMLALAKKAGGGKQHGRRRA